MIRDAISRLPDRAHPVIRHARRQGPSDLFGYWRQRETALHEGRFIAWANEFALCRDVRVDFSKCRGRRGERAFVGDGTEFEAGHCALERGFLQLDGVSGRLSYDLPQALGYWAESLTETDVGRDEVRHPEPETALLLARYEYANLFHVLSELYSAFLVLRFLEIDPSSVTVVLMDRHPSSPLDAFAEAMFGGVRRADDFQGVHRFAKVVFSPLGHRSPLTARYQKRPYLADEFSGSILRSFGLSPRRVESVRRLTFIRRRDYRERGAPSGNPVQRQIANEDQLITELKRELPGVDVCGARFEEFSVADQLGKVCETDILVGMHGAGLTHALFLPAGAGVVELFPRFLPSTNDHYYNIARWRGLPYTRWKNRERRYELAGVATYFPPSLLIAAIRRLIARIEKEAR